jgi:hypothetical protein
MTTGSLIPLGLPVEGDRFMNTAYLLSSYGLERVNYFDGQIMTARDMLAEEQYFLQKIRRHNRFLHGWGVAAGLGVSAAPIPDEPGRIRIDCGYALSPQGDEIYVPEPFCYDLMRCGIGAVSDPCEPGFTTTVRPAGENLRLYIALRYTECPTRPVRTHPTGCGCDSSGCAYTRIRDDYTVECLLELPATHRPERMPMLCELRQAGQVPPCPTCPEEPWVVIAQVSWNPNRAIANDDINYLVRRQVYSTALLQAQVIDCCCAGRVPPPASRPGTVVSVQPATNAIFTAGDVPGGGPNPPPDHAQIEFDKGLQPATVNASTFLVSAQTGNRPPLSIAGEVAYNPGKNTARFTPNQPFGSLVTAAGPVTIFIRVRGSGANPIRDVDNLILDGDGDRTEGGDFTSRFEVR